MESKYICRYLVTDYVIGNAVYMATSWLEATQKFNAEHPGHTDKVLSWYSAEDKCTFHMHITPMGV